MTNVNHMSTSDEVRLCLRNVTVNSANQETDHAPAEDLIHGFDPRSHTITAKLGWRTPCVQLRWLT